MNSISLFMVTEIYEYGIYTDNGTYYCSGPNEYPLQNSSPK